MRIVKCSIFICIALFVFAENAAATRTLDPETLDITSAFKTVTREMFIAYKVIEEMLGFGGNRTITEEFDGNTIKIKNEECHSKIQLSSRNSSKLLRRELSFVSVEISHYLNDYLLNTKERHYTIGDIRTSNYTLSNVTISGLWNVQSFTLNASNLEAAPQVEFGAVSAFIVQNFAIEGKQPLELNFNASKVYIYTNQKDAGRLHAKITGYSFKNTKTNTFLEENESKSIIAEIESAFVASLLS